MPNHLYLKLVLVTLFAASVVPAFAQVVPAATGGGGLTIAAGGGVSTYQMDFFPYGREWGGTLWVDGDLNLGPRFLQGLGVEAEARDLSLDRSASLPNDFRTDTLGGGPMYTWHFHRLRPYVKGIISYGSLDVYKHSYHFTWTEYAPGGGVEYRTFGNVFVRADYEYQAWFKVFGKNYTLDPNGWTFGAVYQFGHPHLRH